jgi:hypothetical protein
VAHTADRHLLATTTPHMTMDADSSGISSANTAHCRPMHIITCKCVFNHLPVIHLNLVADDE